MQDKAKITDQLYLHIKFYLENIFYIFLIGGYRQLHKLTDNYYITQKKYFD